MPELQSLSDEELAGQSQTGSLEAFEQLVYRYENRIYAFVAQSCRNRTDAGEITQDTFVKAFQALAQFDGRHSFAGWLFTIARHKCIDHFRAAPPVADEPVPELPDQDDPAELLARREHGQELWQFARRWLPETQFHALWLRYAEGMNLAEIAQALRKTQTHVKVLLFRARQTLFQKLQPRQFGNSSSLDAERNVQSPRSKVERPHPKVGGAQAVVETASFSFNPPRL
jgi:RNA polymerase sigma-70 factor, ECF subfamily